MKTLAEIKAMNMEQRNALQEELFALVLTNEIEKVKAFLQEYPLKESFYEEHIEDEDKDRFYLFQVERVLAKAAVAYEKYKDPAMIEFLQEWGLRIDFHTKRGENTLTDYIFENGGEDENVIKYLVDKGLTCEKRDERKDHSGWTPMHWWAMCNDYKSIEIAVTKAGAKVDARDKRGQTPLFAAVKVKPEAYKTTQLLIELGANVNAYALIGTPLDVAQGARNKKLLKDAGAMTSAQIERKFKLPQRELVESTMPEDERNRIIEEYSKLVSDTIKKARESKADKTINKSTKEIKK
ncbi:ankyrin repeat domain-containing protein [Helicobacter sp. MIT 03-1614]|uniref:ankyrin repeat domain-containing protein n=1 Tax=Helicobacter sp. MIT 03-1614 TaxID=1548147 RepID=UPI00068FAA04|nr:ankyrin repeat domain-containing protein [Helicobacter sp. MIT 03-1614]TLD88504.1 ankyrin repeat domain-containing protein [Helicobacter sp. MIT 03-1614]